MLLLAKNSNQRGRGSPDQAKAFLDSAIMLRLMADSFQVANVIVLILPHSHLTTAGPMDQVSDFSALVFWEQCSFRTASGHSSGKSFKLCGGPT